jgi:hypothetical protein
MANNEKRTNGKQEEYRKQTQQSHFGPPQLKDRSYGQNNNNK